MLTSSSRADDSESDINFFLVVAAMTYSLIVITLIRSTKQVKPFTIEKKRKF